MGPITSICCENDRSNNKTALNVKVPQTSSPSSPLEHKKSNQNAEGQQLNQQNNKAQTSRLAMGKHFSQNYSSHDDLDGIEKILRAPHKKMKWTDFNILYLIGSGGFGEVFLGELKENQAEGIVQRYAIKRMKKADVIKKRLTESIRLQKKILEQSSCKFITKLYYAFRDDYYLYIVMEWAEGGDTYTLIKPGSHRIKAFKNLLEPFLRFILGCLILGLQYLHSKQIIYRDLKPENLLIFSDGYVKLTDFGLARQLKENQFTKTLAGTTVYYAPEMVLGYEYGRQIDLWTLGVYSYEMSNFAAPFAAADIKNKMRVKKLVVNAQANRIWKNQGLSCQLKSFIDSLLKFDPKKRLGAKSWDQVKGHSFFTSVGFDWQALETQTMQSPHYKIGYTAYDAAKMNSLAGLPPPQATKDLIPSWSMCKSSQHT